MVGTSNLGSWNGQWQDSVQVPLTPISRSFCWWYIYSFRGVCKQKTRAAPPFRNHVQKLLISGWWIMAPVPEQSSLSWKRHLKPCGFPCWKLGQLCKSQSMIGDKYCILDSIAYFVCIPVYAYLYIIYIYSIHINMYILNLVYLFTIIIYLSHCKKKKPAILSMYWTDIGLWKLMEIVKNTR